MSVKFGELPPVQRGTGRTSVLVDILPELVSHPGAWAVIRTYGSLSGASVMARAIRLGGSPLTRPAGLFEATCRKNGDKFDVWARYVGGAA